MMIAELYSTDAQALLALEARAQSGVSEALLTEALIDDAACVMGCWWQPIGKANGCCWRCVKAMCRRVSFMQAQAFNRMACGGITTRRLTAPPDAKVRC